MNPLDDLPERSDTHDTAEAAEAAFRAAVGACNFFVIQHTDRNDYGTDVQIEARSGCAMTNARTHVQLKGTSRAPNADDSISISVERTNLNYLLAQPESVYVCYHIPSNRLLVRRADDVYSDYEHRGDEWRRQETITVRFNHAFDAAFQARLNARLIALGKSSRDRRLAWVATPPEHFAARVARSTASIEVPFDPVLAQRLLKHLYDAGQDAIISNAFALFEAVLGQQPGEMDLAYMAEVNLGLNGVAIDHERIRKGVVVLQDALRRGQFHPGSLLYCQGNAFHALGEHEAARDKYVAALTLLDGPDLVDIAARCTKNLGSALDILGKAESARKCYERALELAPDLAEAHFALAVWHCRFGNDFAVALDHLDQVASQDNSALRMSSVHGWRIHVLFGAGDLDGAFREINVLLGNAAQEDWIWPWCAKHVSQFAKSSSEGAKKAVRFWRAYLREYPQHSSAEYELLLCYWRLRSDGLSVDLNFSDFKSGMVGLIAQDTYDVAFLWDRVGHWAQSDGNWEEAERAYRIAYELQPGTYGYCLGTALNFLSRHAEALPILVPQATRFKVDSMSWFQVAVAQGGVGDIKSSITSYEQALKLDDEYELAWFNLGGAYWNTGDTVRATQTWREAMRRFPQSKLTAKLMKELPQLFDPAP